VTADGVDARPICGRVVSVVIAAGDDPDAAVDAAERVHHLDWPHDLLDVVIVGPRRPIAAGAKARGLEVRAIRAADEVPLPQARNLGAHAARGEWLAFLDRDAQPDPLWVRSALRAMRSDSGAAAVASKVVDVDGRISFVGGALNSTGEPVFPHAGDADSGAYDTSVPVLFPSPWAIVMETKAFRWVRGFDIRHCRGIEHADLGWRLWLAGLGVRYTGASFVTLRSSAPAPPPIASDARAEMLVKNVDDSNLVAMGLGGGDRTPSLIAERERVQAMRQLPDLQVLPLAQLDLSTRRRVLVVTPDVLQPKMAGPAIRAFRMAVALSAEHDVELVSTVGCDFSHPAFPTSHVTDPELRHAVDRAEIVVIQGHVIDHHPWLRKTDRLLVADIYDPFHLEVLEYARDLSPNDRRVMTRLTIETLNEQLARGDFFLCASEKQRDFWLGQLAAVGRINPSTYDQHENLNSLIAIAPFGVDEEPPTHTNAVLRGVQPGIGDGDKIILWGGGVYNWFDPLTLVHAVDKLRSRLPNVRLYFMGMTHPNPRVPAMRMAFETQKLAKELDLVGTHVFFNEGWVDYDDRQNYLLEADVGVSTHFEHIETAYSFRTRILDYLWASLPVVASDGDGFAEVIRRHGLGLVVPPEDVDALEQALYSLLADDDRRQACQGAIRSYVPEVHWGKALAPLLEFCRKPARAPDLVDPRQRSMIGDPLAQAMWGKRGWKHTARVVVDHVRHFELGGLFRKVRMRIRTKLHPHTAGPGARTDTF